MCKITFKVILTTCILFIFSGILNAGITSTDAKDIVLNNILGDEIEKVNVYESDQILTSQNSVTLWNGQTVSSQYENSWFYFVDDRPIAKWHHPCRLIFINEANGEYEIINKTIFPMDYERDMVLIAGYDKHETVEVPETTIHIQTEKATPNEHLYAVIINGSEHEEVRFWNDMSAMYCALLDKGYTKDNIYVHYYGETHSSDLNGDGSYDDIDKNATKDLIEATFARLSTELDYDDQLFVYIDGHGYNSHIVDGVNDKENEDDYVPGSYIDLKGEEDISALELAGYVESINCAQMIFTIGCCFSGGFATRLNDYTAETKCTNRTVYTASFNEEALAERWLTYYEGESRYHEFFYYWTAAIRGYFPDISQPWNVLYPVGEYPFIETLETNQRYLANVANGYDSHPGAKDPDYDGDGYLQMNDVFRYTNDLNSWTENGYNNPYSTDYVDELPQKSYNDVLISQLLSMKGLCGNIEPSNTQEKLSWPPQPSDLEVQTITGNLMVNPKLTIKPGVSLNYVGDKTMTFVPGDPGEAKISYEDGLVIETLSKFVIEDSHLVFEEGAQLTMLDWSFFEAKGNTSITGNVMTANTTLMTIMNDSEMHLNSGSNLTIADGAILDIGSNSDFIVEPGANMIFEPNSNVKVFGNLILKNSESLSYGTHLELFSGAKLIIEESASLYIEDNVIIDVYEGAEILVRKDASFKTVHPILPDGVVRTDPQFNYIPIDGYWNGIVGEVDSEINIANVSITNAISGVSGAPLNCIITNSTFTNCQTGIDLINCDNYSIILNTLQGKGLGSGVVLTSSNGFLRDNTIENYNNGIEITLGLPIISDNLIQNNTSYGLHIIGYNAFPMLTPISTSKNNDIINNGLGQIFLKYSASVYLEGGLNNIYSEIVDELPIAPCIVGESHLVSKVDLPSRVDIPAFNNYWGSDVVTDGFFDLYYRYNLLLEPLDEITDKPFSDEVMSPIPGNEITFDERMLSQAVKFELDGKLDQAIKKLEIVLDKNSDLADSLQSQEYVLALAKLPVLYAKQEIALEPLVKIFDANIESDDETINKKFYKEMKVSTKIKGKKYDEAIALAEEMKLEAASDGEVILAEIDIAIANMMKDAESKGKSRTDHTATISDLLTKLNGTEVEGEEKTDIVESQLPTAFSLEQNYPNPFNPTTEIKFALPSASDVKLNVYNINGQLVSELVNGNEEAGIHKVSFDASNFNSGMYFYTLEANGTRITNKMILTK